MRCFNHPETEAIGTCKACNKGLCLECAADLGHGLACKSAHVEAVEDMNTLMARNVRIGNINARGKMIMPLFYGFMGVVFLFSATLTGNRVSSFSFAMGIGFIVFAFVSMVTARKAWRK